MRSLRIRGEGETGRCYQFWLYSPIFCDVGPRLTGAVRGRVGRIPPLFGTWGLFILEWCSIRQNAGSMVKSTDITVLLKRAREGDPGAKQAVLPVVYDALRELANSKMRRVQSGHTLQPTALVHEVYLRIMGDDADFENRAHFFFVASRAMRDILVDHARQKASAKRGGDQVFVSTDDIVITLDMPADELLAIDQAMKRLEEESPRQHNIVLLRFFGGFTTSEAARALGIGERTAERDWRFARAFLHSVLSKAAS